MVFKKTYPTNPISLSNGKGLRFADVGNNIGFLVTEDPFIITELKAAMASGRGGIQESSQDEYDEALKKKPISLNSRLNSSTIREIQTAGLTSVVPTPELLHPALAGAASPVASAVEVPAVVPTTPPEPKVVKRQTK